MQAYLDIKFKDGQAKLKYQELRKIFINRHHINIQIATHSNIIIPWKDIPENKREELKVLLEKQQEIL